MNDDGNDLPACPHCDSDDASCPHLLVRVDRTFGEMKGDEWWEISAPAFEALDEAARGLVTRLPGLSDKVQSAVHTHLATTELTESFRFLTDEMKHGDELASIRGNGDRGWHSFLAGLLEDVAEPVENQYEGGPGMSSVETFYFAPDAKAAARDFADSLRQEAKTLDGFVEEKTAPPEKTEKPKAPAKKSPSKAPPRRK